MNSKQLIGIAAVMLLSLSAFASVGAQVKDKSQSREVKVEGGRVNLAGTLTMPRLAPGKKAPVVLIIPDSGMTTRDGVAFGSAKHAIYRELADHLASKGFASMRFDRRCAGASECKPAETFDDYIDDAHGVINFLRNQEQIDPARIFLFGHGEGAQVASSLATHEENKIAGLIVSGMAGRRHSKILADRIQKSMTEDGKPAAEIDAYIAKVDRVTKAMMSGHAGGSNEKLDPKNKYDAILLDLIDQKQVAVGLIVNDPLQIIRTVKAPVLIIQGGKDVLTAVKDAIFIEEALKRVYHPDVTLQIFEQDDHLLKVNKGAAGFGSLADASRPVDSTALIFISDWLDKRSKSVKGGE